MDESPEYTKRKKYDQPTYARLLDQFTQLMNDVPKLRPDRDAWDIEGDWSATGIIHFVNAVHQPSFEPVRDFDCRSIKFVNMDKPAVRITFYRKHRYTLIKAKDMTSEMKTEQIKVYIDDLIIKARILELKLSTMLPFNKTDAKGEIGLYWEQIKIWQAVLDDPSTYDVAMSNYERQHFYVTANYKYRLPSGDYTNEQEHLLNTQRDRLGNITQVRYNILFVDVNEIFREHPYQNREVENYLKNFLIKSAVGRYKLYARPKPRDEAQDGFK